MTNAKHTPGPWKVAERHGVIDVMGVGSGVCRVFTDPNQNSLPTMPQARANARLIAAAPDLLGFARLVADLEAKCRSEGGRHPTYAEWAVLATSIPAIVRAAGGGE